MNKAPEMPEKVRDLISKADQALEGLRAKVEKIHQMPPAIIAECGAKEYDVQDGKSLAWPLWTEEKVSVARWFNKAGTNFPDHAHNEREWLIVYSGEIRVHKEDGSEIVVKEGEMIYLPNGVLHGGYSVVDAYFIGVTVPRSPDYPA